MDKKKLNKGNLSSIQHKINTTHFQFVYHAFSLYKTITRSYYKFYTTQKKHKNIT